MLGTHPVHFRHTSYFRGLAWLNRRWVCLRSEDIIFRVGLQRMREWPYKPSPMVSFKGTPFRFIPKAGGSFPIAPASLSCWCSVGNEGRNLGIPLKETTSWMVYRRHSISHSLPCIQNDRSQVSKCITTAPTILFSSSFPNPEGHSQSRTSKWLSVKTNSPFSLSVPRSQRCQSIWRRTSQRAVAKGPSWTRRGGVWRAPFFCCLFLIFVLFEGWPIWRLRKPKEIMVRVFGELREIEGTHPGAPLWHTPICRSWFSFVPLRFERDMLWRSRPHSFNHQLQIWDGGGGGGGNLLERMGKYFTPRPWSSATGIRSSHRLEAAFKTPKLHLLGCLTVWRLLSRLLDCYWVGSLDFNFSVAIKWCFPLTPPKVVNFLQGVVAATKTP